MATNDFLVFAGGAGANVVSQSTYASLTALAGGFVTGIAQSSQLNKVWRQGSIMASVLGQLIAAVTGANSVDDGTTVTLLGNLLTTLQAAEYTPDTSGVANSYTLTFSPAPITPLTNGVMYAFSPAHTNTTSSTLSVNGSPAHAIISRTHAALTGGELQAGGFVVVIYSSALSSFIIVSNTGSGVAPKSAWGYGNAAAQSVTGTVNYQTAGNTATGLTSFTAGVATVAAAGTYNVEASATANNGTPNSGTATLTIYHNGSPTTYTNSWFTGTGQDEGVVTVSGPIDCAAGDTISIQATLSASAVLVSGKGCFNGNRLY